MPRIIDYPEVLDTLAPLGLKCLYHNSGAFGFSNPTGVEIVGWITRDDPTLRPAARQAATLVAPPSPNHLASLATRALRDVLPGPAWITPLSHWAYELDFGNRDWLPAALADLGLHPPDLATRNTGDALAFDASELPQLQQFISRLLANLKISDFLLTCPSRPLTCTIHHHQQLWWQSNDPALAAALRQLAPDASSH